MPYFLLKYIWNLDQRVIFASIISLREYIVKPACNWAPRKLRLRTMSTKEKHKSTKEIDIYLLSPCKTTPDIKKSPIFPIRKSTENMTRVTLCIIPHSITEHVIFISKLLVNQGCMIPLRYCHWKHHYKVQVPICVTLHLLFLFLFIWLVFMLDLNNINVYCFAF